MTKNKKPQPAYFYCASHELNLSSIEASKVRRISNIRAMQFHQLFLQIVSKTSRKARILNFVKKILITLYY